MGSIIRVKRKMIKMIKGELEGGYKYSRGRE